MLILTPPQYPILLEYNPRAFAHLRTHRTTVKNVWYRFGVPPTSFEIRFVTRVAFMVRLVEVSTPSTLASLSISKSSETLAVLSRAKSKSMFTPSQSKVRIGTAAPSTGTKLVTSGCLRTLSARESGSTGAFSPSSEVDVPKISCRVHMLGITNNVSDGKTIIPHKCPKIEPSAHNLIFNNNQTAEKTLDTTYQYRLLARGYLDGTNRPYRAVLPPRLRPIWEDHVFHIRS